MSTIEGFRALEAAREHEQRKKIVIVNKGTRNILGNNGTKPFPRRTQVLR